MSEKIEPSSGSGFGKGGLQFGQRPMGELWGYARRDPKWRADGNRLVHVNGNALKWHAERNCWVSA